jgi:hypothetical protein
VPIPRSRTATSAVATAPTLPTISADALPLPLRLRFAIATRTPAVAVSSIVAVSTTVRGLVAWRHSTPRYFPDEYIYATLGRSIAHFRFDIRGGVPHFPAVLEPVLAAPLWGAFSTETAYHLVQLENALAMSLAAVPAYLLARRLRLDTRWSLACAAYAVAIPTFTLVAYVMADPVAYPLALAAVGAAVNAIDRPSRRAQVAFIAFAALASLGRIQYVVLFAAYAGAAAVVSRRNLVRDHRIVAATVAVGLLGVAASGPRRILGYYSGILNLHVGAAAATWFGTHAFILSLAAGVVIVPGAVVTLVAPRGRTQTAFAVFTSLLAALLLLEASLYAANGEGRFKERYVFALLPLLAVAFGVYVENRRPGRLGVALVATAVIVAVARLPLSTYATATAKTDSQFLFAVGFIEDKLGAASMSLLAAAIASALAVAAVALSFWRRQWPALAIALALLTAASAAASYVDLTVTSAVRGGTTGPLSWVDARAKGHVTAVETPFSSSTDLITTLFWNPSVDREVVMRGAVPTDAFAALYEGVRPDGTLSSVHGDVLVNDFGTTAVLAGAHRLAVQPPFTLWRTNGRVAFRELLAGRFDDGWLNEDGRLRAWPRRPGDGTELSFRLSLPASWSKPRVRVHLGGSVFVVGRGRHVEVVCRAAAGRLDTAFSSPDVVFDNGFRRLTARMTHVRLTDLPRGRTRLATLPGWTSARCTS